MKYLVRKTYEGKKGEEETIRSLHRWSVEKDKVISERWDGSKWIDDPELIAHFGIGGDENYTEIQQEEVEKVKASLK